MYNLFDLKFYKKTCDDLIKELECCILKKERVYAIYTPNVEHIISCKENTAINEIYKNADYIIADGWPIVVVSKIKGDKVSRITGVDLAEKLLQISNKNKLNVFFLGCTDGTLKLLKDNVSKEYPDINKFGCNNGFFKADENDKIIEMINNNETDILFVGMGHPKQEIWIDKNKNRLNCTVCIGIGGGFKIFSKEVKRAPKFIQKIGMEWLWRFLKEPRRLFNRYFIRYPKFIKIAFKEIMTNRGEQK